MDELKEFNPTFENGGFWEYYKDLERQFEDFLVYVPYLDGNEKTYSFRLANLLLNIGAHVDSAFKEIARYPELSNKYPNILKKADGTVNKPTIWDYYILANEYNLQKTYVLFKRLPDREMIFPFRDYKKQVNFEDEKEKVQPPYWWDVYNAVKHHFKDNFYRANLKTTRDALAGAFLLNVVHKPAVLRLNDIGLLKPIDPEEGQLITSMIEDNFLHNSFPPAIIETNLFYYEYGFGCEYK